MKYFIFVFLSLQGCAATHFAGALLKGAGDGGLEASKNQKTESCRFHKEGYTGDYYGDCN